MESEWYLSLSIVVDTLIELIVFLIYLRPSIILSWGVDEW